MQIFTTISLQLVTFGAVYSFRGDLYLIDHKRRKVVGLGRFELPTHGLGNRCSILLSYRPTTLILLRLRTSRLSFRHILYAQTMPILTRTLSFRLWGWLCRGLR